MGMYLYSVSAGDWFDDDEGGLAETATALDAELRRLGLPAYRPGPAAAPFEEKLVPPMDGFSRLGGQHLSTEEFALLCDWTLLVPISLEKPIHLPIESQYFESTTIAGAPQVQAIAEKLAAAIALPAEVPAAPHNLTLTTWFLDGPAKALAATDQAPWADDLDASFYVALYLRAAQHALRHHTPLTYS
ncbi:hypothetical protein GCM10009554_74360 [Kribbella koreensis]|uniref:SUKH-4 immunity protein of toxin-antitoxin system n=1 Tax=Kribbella koreensis TaxID=57909 RepID=A0ABN1RMC7_9ACTN